MNKPKLVVYGVGSMASTYAMYLEDEFDVVAYTATSEYLSSDSFNGKPLYPFEKIDTILPPQDHQMSIAVGYVQLNKIRESIAEQAKLKGYALATHISPDVKRHSSIEVGQNTIIFDKTSIHPNCKIGDNVFISSNVQLGHDCIIGNNVWINAGVCIGGGTKIEDNTFIGMNSTISHGITVGKKSIVGAATLVTKSISDESVIIAPAGEVQPLKSEVFLRLSGLGND